MGVRNWKKANQQTYNMPFMQFMKPTKLLPFLTHPHPHPPPKKKNPNKLIQQGKKKQYNEKTKQNSNLKATPKNSIPILYGKSPAALV